MWTNGLLKNRIYMCMLKNRSFIKPREHPKLLCQFISSNYFFFFLSYELFYKQIHNK